MLGKYSTTELHSQPLILYSTEHYSAFYYGASDDNQVIIEVNKTTFDINADHI
jgi:hypothetical protein